LIEIDVRMLTPETRLDPNSFRRALKYRACRADTRTKGDVAIGPLHGRIKQRAAANGLKSVQRARALFGLGTRRPDPDGTRRGCVWYDRTR